MAKVLIVDDDKDISELVSLVLEKEEIESDIINNPLDALKLLENGSGEYDLILLDIMISLLLFPFKMFWAIIKTIFKIIFYPIWFLFHVLASL